MPEPTAHITRSEEPNPLAEVLDKYRDTPIVGAGSNKVFVGRIVIEIFEGKVAFPEGGEIASTWVLPSDRDAGLIFQRVAVRLDEMGKQLSGSQPAGGVTSAA